VEGALEITLSIMRNKSNNLADARSTCSTFVRTRSVHDCTEYKVLNDVVDLVYYSHTRVPQAVILESSITLSRL
jgi:hypothetical protein